MCSETWDAWKILYPQDHLHPAATNKIFTGNSIPWLSHHWKRRVGITAADLDTMDSSRSGLLHGLWGYVGF